MEKVMDNTNGITFALFRVHLELEALIAALSQEYPDLGQRILQETAKFRATEKFRGLLLETKQQILKANDGVWMKEHGISEGTEGS